MITKKKIVFLLGVLFILFGGFLIFSSQAYAQTAPSITILSPNGGEQWVIGNTYDITWSSVGVKTVTLNLLCANIYGQFNACGSILGTNVIGIDASLGRYSWKIPFDNPNIPNNKVKILVAEGAKDLSSGVYDPYAGIYDESDAPFLIKIKNVAPKITATGFPLSLEVGEIGTFHWTATDANNDNLSWSVSWGDGAVQVQSCPYPEKNWNFTAKHTFTASGTYPVKALASDCKGGSDTRIVDMTVGGGVITPSITVLSPNGGEIWKVGSVRTMTYDLTNWSEPSVLIYLELYHPIGSVKEGNVNNSFLIAETKDLKSFAYTIPTFVQSGNTYKVKVCNRFCTISDSSDAYFSVVSSTTVTPPITVLSPNGGEEWVIDTAMTIRWNIGSTPREIVSIFAQRCAPGENVENCATMNVNFPIASNTFNDGEFSWDVGTLEAGMRLGVGTYLISIREPTTLVLLDESDAYFSVVATPSITSFNYTETDAYGGSLKFSWTSAGTDGVELQIPCYSGLIITDAITGTNFLCGDIDRSLSPNSSIYLKFTNTSGALINVTATLTPIVGNIGHDTYSKTLNFSIVSSIPSITVLSPNGGEQWVMGNTYDITWEAEGFFNLVFISLVNEGLLGEFGQPYWCRLTPGYVSAEDGRYPWTIGKGDCQIFPGDKFKIEIQEPEGMRQPRIKDTSDNYFSIMRSEVTECLTDGTLIKTPLDPKVYVIIDCKKQWIQTREEFQEKEYEWEDVQEISSPVIQAYAEYLVAEANLLRAIGHDKVYRIIEDKILWIPTISVFNAQGLKWEDIQEVDEVDVGAYPKIKLMRASGDPKVYYVTESGLKKWIRTADVFNSYNNRWEDVVEVESGVIGSLEDVALIRLQGGTKVYKLENGIKRWIKTQGAFTALNLDWNLIASVNQTELESYVEGSLIE